MYFWGWGSKILTCGSLLLLSAIVYSYKMVELPTIWVPESEPSYKFTWDIGHVWEVKCCCVKPLRFGSYLFLLHIAFITNIEKEICDPLWCKGIAYVSSRNQKTLWKKIEGIYKLVLKGRLEGLRWMTCENKHFPTEQIIHAKAKNPERVHLIEKIHNFWGRKVETNCQG